ncbi:unnamed protein product [Pocillopora meandrina]|uniref:Uncharacterized protein n=1 Tax=Pocillopora meandrina TaxID=46732 RepID=A0AAU9XQ84_9CNID|nr:unnamed protein product [Pocillopora meandrina]
MLDFARRNETCHRGRYVEGKWVFDGICRETKACILVPDEGYNHLTVNHSLNFVDPDTGAHTQRIENTRCGIKRSIPCTGISKDLFGSYLQEWL